MSQPQDMAGVPTLPRESHVVMQEPGGYYDNGGYVPEWVNDNNPCSTSDVAKVQVDVDMTKVQVCYVREVLGGRVHYFN